MYGKMHKSLYSGSMVGKGSAMFAVWGYVIANLEPERVEAGRARGATVELNPKLLAFIIGEKQKIVEDVITQLCAPDPESRTKDQEGRRLVRTGEFSFHVVNGETYRSMRSTDDRREYQRVKQAEYRVKRKRPGVVTGGPPRERQYAEALGDGQEPEGRLTAPAGAAVVEPGEVGGVAGAPQ